MYRTKLYLAFATLLALTIVQAAIAMWTSHAAAQQMERSRVANRILVEFIALGADKQRLKVWLAQSLLTDDSAPTVRERYLEQMQGNLQRLNLLITQDQMLLNDSANISDINQQLKSLSILETNVAALRTSLARKAAEQHDSPRSASETWVLLIQIFDNLEGLDLKTLIAQAIELQEQRVGAAEKRAAVALQRVKSLVLATAAMSIALAVGLAIVLARGMYQPIQRLLTGTTDLAEGRLHVRLPESGQQEFRLLARSFNQLAAHLESARAKEEQLTRKTEQLVQERTAQLQEAVNRLQNAEQLQQQFLADVSHELRTPATTIRGEAEVALRGHDKNTQEYKESLLRIAESSQQLSGRIDDLLLLIRSDQALSLRFSQFAVFELWPQWCELARRITRANDVPVKLGPITDNLASLQIFIDREKLDQSLQILLENACRYGLGKPVCLHLAATQEHLLVHVVDGGIGIPAAAKPEVFSRYFRAENARSLRPDGLGIGLSLCRTLVEAQHGRVLCESPVTTATGNEAGTRMTLVLPLIEDEEKPNERSL